MNTLQKPTRVKLTARQRYLLTSYKKNTRKKPFTPAEHKEIQDALIVLRENDIAEAQYQLDKAKQQRDEYTEIYLKKFHNRMLMIRKQCDSSVQGVRGVGTTWTQQWNQAISTGKAEIRKQERALRLEAQRLAIYKEFAHLRKEDTTDDELNHHARNLGNAIFDFPHLQTGYMTEAAINAVKEERTHDHFYPRKWAGFKMLEYIFQHNGISLTAIEMFLEVFAQVHITTKVENQKLKPFQETETFESWEKSYESAGLKLLQIEDRGPIKKTEDLWQTLTVVA